MHKAARTIWICTCVPTHKRNRQKYARAESGMISGGRFRPLSAKGCAFCCALGGGPAVHRRPSASGPAMRRFRSGFCASKMWQKDGHAPVPTGAVQTALRASSRTEDGLPLAERKMRLAPSVRFRRLSLCRFCAIIDISLSIERAAGDRTAPNAGQQTNVPSAVWYGAGAPRFYRKDEAQSNRASEEFHAYPKKNAEKRKIRHDGFPIWKSVFCYRRARYGRLYRLAGSPSGRRLRWH